MAPGGGGQAEEGRCSGRGDGGYCVCEEVEGASEQRGGRISCDGGDRVCPRALGCDRLRARDDGAATMGYMGYESVRFAGVKLSEGVAPFADQGVADGQVGAGLGRLSRGVCAQGGQRRRLLARRLVCCTKHPWKWAQHGGGCRSALSEQHCEREPCPERRHLTMPAAAAVAALSCNQ